MSKAQACFAIACLTQLTSCADVPEALNMLPSFLGPIASASYDGLGDDLLTGGLGRSGLAADSAPAFAIPAKPTAQELRRNAIYTNYRAVLDINPRSGYGTLYGPNVDAAGNPTTSEGKVAGIEFTAFAGDTTLMVQVPSTFDPGQACIVTGTSSGSRGIYGAIGTSGEWGLKNGCAVAYADKGTGVGLYSFEDDGVNLQDGRRSTRSAAGGSTVFAPTMTDAERTAFAAAYPGRVAFKHAHSERNPERDWGRATLQAVEFAFYVLNERYGGLARDGHSHLARLVAGNTLVIASSISNGGGAALRAAEMDMLGLIDAVAVSEPQVQPQAAPAYSVRQGGVPVASQGGTLLDYASFAALYQPCIAGGAGRCAGLVRKGMLSGADLASQQADAQARMVAYGWQPESAMLQGAHALTSTLVAVTYLNAYGRFAARDNICGFSFAKVDAGGMPVPFTVEERAASFATMDGIAGTPVYEDSVGGARSYVFGISPSTGAADQSLDGFLCLRSLAQHSGRVAHGLGEVKASGNLHGKPAIIVAGRSDTLIPVNHAARAYVGLNAAMEGAGSRLRYVEVLNANHFDSYSSALPAAIVPLHVYLFRALDAIKSGSLPPSQIVRTRPRASGAETITVANVPPFAAHPGSDEIRVVGSTVDIPN